MESSQSNLHQWANPGPSGLFALALVLLTLWASFTGLVDGKASATMIIAWLALAGLVQTIVGLIQLRNGNFMGNLQLLFGMFFCIGIALCKGISLFAPEWFLAKLGYHVPDALLGVVLCYLAFVLACYLPIVIHAPSVVFYFTLFSVPCIAAIGLLDMGILDRAVIGKPLGWAIGAVDLLCIYSAVAELVNQGLRKQVFPMGKPLVGAGGPSH